MSDNSRTRLALVLAATLAGGASTASGQVAPPPSPQAGVNGAAFENLLTGDRRRLAAQFDFNERPLGNYESLPMRWERYRAWGYPHYLAAGFDETVGHGAPPSFRFDLNGGSVAFLYVSRTIEVVPANDYVILAWVRTEGLRRARACISAAYMDRTGAVLANTEVFSRPVGGTDNGPWHRLKIELRAGVREARFVALGLWLTQPGAIPEGERGTPASADDIEDIHGTAWFDDIEVYRVPHDYLETGMPGNVFPPGRPPVLLVRVSDPDGTGLEATLTVRDAEGAELLRRTLPIRPVRAVEPDRIELPDRGPGQYSAELSVSTSAGTLASRTLQFVRLGAGAARGDPAHRAGRGFGVEVVDLLQTHMPDQLALIEHLNPEWVKVPVWHMASLASSSAAAREPAIDAHLSRLAAAGHEPVGWIGRDRPPRTIRRETGTLLDLLGGPAETWQPRLAYTWSLYAGLIGWWQFGDEEDTELVRDPRLPGVMTAVRQQMTGILNNPAIVMPADLLGSPGLTDGAPAPGPAQALAAYLPSDIPPERFSEYWPRSGLSNGFRLWLTIEPLPVDRYPRLERLTDLTKRLILAKANNASAIFLRQPWSVSAAGGAAPTEDYVFFRTVSASLEDSTGIGRLAIDGRVECHVFDRGGRAVMAVWDDYAPPSGRICWMSLDAGATQTDPWGGVTRLTAVGDEYPVRIGRMPTFVQPLPTWIVRLRQGFAVTPPRIEARLAQHERTVRFENPLAEPISGEVRLVAPAGWEIRPSSFRFALAPGQVHEERVALTFSINEPAGTKVILSEFVIDADRVHRLRIPAWLELGLEGIEVETFTQRTDGRAVIRQTVTNRTDAAVSFYSHLTAAQRERQTRLIANLQPGQTATREFVLENAAELAGRRMRLALQEVGGSRVWNSLLDVP